MTGKKKTDKKNPFSAMEDELDKYYEGTPPMDDKYLDTCSHQTGEHCHDKDTKPKTITIWSERDSAQHGKTKHSKRNKKS